MKNYVKKLISSLMAISLAASVFSGIPVFAENSDGTIVDQTQALTVVGKRIKGDDTYFEISLEVNDEHDNYSSVGVVLRYDPDYIIPAESWDEGAGAADMSENTTWATRRALPTLGLETWSTHTALAYQEDTPAPGAAGGKKYGYLYLGAEHPLAVEEPEATADPSATAAPTADPSAPTAEPEATPAPGTRPVVVARFMYKTTAGDATAAPPIVEVTGADMKAKLTEDWTTGTNSSGAAQPTNWDYDWTANKILTIADDDVAGKSPAQYPFAIYTQDYVEKAYMKTWPTVTPTATTAPGDPTPTPMPVSAYAPVIGTGVDTANHLTKDDIMIITCEGESAKSQGGLKLSDIYVIIFFDWDDTIIGTLTAGRGLEMSKDVSEYVREKMVHPDLQSNTNYSSLDRVDTYRGKYPETGPNSSDPLAETGAYGDDAAQPGSKYPVTNKLEYVLAGKTFYLDAPYAGGWTQVDASTLSDVYSWYSGDEILVDGKYNRVDKDTGYAFDMTTNTPDASVALPELESFNFDTVDLPEGESTVLVKAVYCGCPDLGKVSTYYSCTDDNPVYGMMTDLSSTATRAYSISFDYNRINTSGYGVERAKQPKVKMDLTPDIDGAKSTSIQLDVTNGETIKVTLTPSNGIRRTDYQLRDIIGANIMTGAQRSLPNTTPFLLADFKLRTEYLYFLTEAFNLASTGKGSITAQVDDYKNVWNMRLSYKKKAGKTKESVTQITNANTASGYIKDFIQKGIAAGDITSPEQLTWYQLQTAILTSGKTYYNASAAKTYFENAQNDLKTATNKWNMPALDFLDANGNFIP